MKNNFKKIINNRKILKDKFRKRKLIFGGWVSFAELGITEMFSSIEFDLISIDMEHSSISLEQARNIILTSQLNNTPCLPRPVSHSNDYIKPLLDLGADGMLFPVTNDKNELKNLINKFKFPKIGNRSFGVNRAQNYGLNFTDYLNKWNEFSILIPQIETVTGIENIEEILENKYVDAVMIGPYDLSGSLGDPGNTQSAKVKKMCKRVVDVSKKLNKSCGIQIESPDIKNVNYYLKLGFNFIFLSSDLFILKNESLRLDSLIKKFR